MKVNSYELVLITIIAKSYSILESLIDSIIMISDFISTQPI